MVNQGLPADTIDFKNPANQVSHGLSLEAKVTRIKSILTTHRLDGENIVLYSDEPATYLGQSEIANILTTNWNQQLNIEWDPIDDNTPQLYIQFNNNAFKVVVETYPACDVVSTFEHHFDYDEVDDIIKIILSTDHIYNTYEFTVY